MSLRLDRVVKQYSAGDQPVRALDGVDLTIEGGQFVSLVAPSGAGKSTLLHMLGALDVPDSGSVIFDGVDITRLSDNEQSDFRRHKVGFVFQFFNLLPTMSAWENVAVPKLLDGMPIRKAKVDALRLLDMVGMADRAEHRPAQLSGGQIQRIAIARALIMNPALLIADEPTGNLDSKTSQTVLNILADIAHDSDGTRAVVMATHDLEAARNTDRVISMLDGRIDTDVLSGSEL
ncbi:ABC transporter ATP-binding protein [Rhodococcus sp. H36-A4]|uniref:ABC transporter ATP-binding protein n=1 Tax=Rhodococcus sp. H36-A4 TaxID=3004353 RepID=UPI0022AFB7FD|nr:ABC transporter ATP-binding protein [Rhodococcus sp. H36-A4]MCZ4076555.1 ABC transporter ATP-binding protein [Rhodococcus sp. H36-A4]